MAPFQHLPSVVEEYYATFGDPGIFDRSLFPEPVTIALCAEALRRGTPITQEDLELQHQLLYGTPMPASGQAAHPSGATVPEPTPDPVWPPPGWVDVSPESVTEGAPAEEAEPKEAERASERVESER